MNAITVNVKMKDVMVVMKNNNKGDDEAMDVNEVNINNITGAVVDDNHLNETSA